jgi:hypothetical protein
MALPAQIEVTLPLLEKHFVPEELAESWGLSVDTVRRIFSCEPGTLVIEMSRNGKTGRRYRTLRIPESVAARVYRRFANPSSSRRRAG